MNVYKELIINAALAAAWVFAATIADFPAIWAVPAAGALRFAIGFVAQKLGHPVPVDS